VVRHTVAQSVGADDDFRLFCCILEKPTNPFPSKAHTVGQLKQEIRRVSAPSLDHMNSASLTLWKVSHTYSGVCSSRHVLASSKNQKPWNPTKALRFACSHEALMCRLSQQGWLLERSCGRSSQREFLRATSTLSCSVPMVNRMIALRYMYLVLTIACPGGVIGVGKRRAGE
jgi:Crinkler effector protein N-terminal domain